MGLALPKVDDSTVSGARNIYWNMVDAWTTFVQTSLPFHRLDEVLLLLDSFLREDWWLPVL
jgi:hypothetical protein